MSTSSKADFFDSRGYVISDLGRFTAAITSALERGILDVRQSELLTEQSVIYHRKFNAIHIDLLLQQCVRDYPIEFKNIRLASNEGGDFRLLDPLSVGLVIFGAGVVCGFLYAMS